MSPTDSPGRPDIDRDRRIQARVPLEIEVDIQSDSNFFVGYLENISYGGIFVATHCPAKLGDVVPVRFKLPYNDAELEIDVDAEVAWLREFNPGLPDVLPGMGLRFIMLTSEQIRAIESYIKNNRDPMFVPEDFELDPE